MEVEAVGLSTLLCSSGHEKVFTLTCIVTLALNYAGGQNAQLSIAFQWSQLLENSVSLSLTCLII
jgi:hypothetical protein